MHPPITRRSRPILALLLITVAAGCTVSPGGGGGLAVSFTIGGKTFTISLGLLDPFEVSANSEPVRQAADANLFDGTPADTASGGSLTMDANRVTARPRSIGKGQVAAQGVTGSATVGIYISSVTAADPCQEGANIGSFELTFEDGVVTVANPALVLSPTALAEIITGSFSICLELTATVDVILIIDEIGVEFGPAIDDGTGPIDGGDNVNGFEPGPVDNENAGGDDNDNGAEPEPVDNENAGDDQNENAAEPPEGCVNDTDCGPDQVCVDGSCVPGASEPKFSTAEVIHVGSEQIIVGPLADEANGYGFLPDSGFGVTHIALSGNGQNLWFITYNEFFEVEADKQRLYVIHIDGTSLLRSAVPLDSITDGFGVPIINNLATGDDGLRAVIEARRNIPLTETASVFFDVLAPGLSATFLFDTLGQEADPPFRAGIRMSDDGNFVSWTDGTSLWRHPMNILNTVPDLEFTAADFVCNGTPAREINEFDRTTVDARTVFQPSAFDTAADAWCHSVVIGSSQTDSADQDMTRNDHSVNSVHITDDGLTMGYCFFSGGSQADPAPCFVQPVHGTAVGFSLTPTSDTWDKFSNLILADRADRYRAVVTTNVFAPNGISFFETAGQDDRRTTGTTVFGGNSQSVSSVQLSYDGEVMAGIAGALSSTGNIYVLHDGRTGLDGFPSIESIAYRYEDDALIVRVQVTSENGVNLVQVYPMKNGIDPGEYLQGEENPFSDIRFGFGGTVEPIEGSPDTYEQSIPLFGLRALIDDSYVLRFVAVDGTGSRTVFADIQAPLPPP